MTNNKIPKSTVGDCFKIIGGGTPSTKKVQYWSGAIPWITSADIDENGYIKFRKYITKEAIEDSATSLVPKGSIVVVTRVGLGKLATAPCDLCFSQDCQALVFDRKKFEPRFVEFQLRVAVQIFKHISRGTTISGVTKKQLKELPFWAPDRDTQKQIVALIERQNSRLESAQKALESAQNKLFKLRWAVLNHAFQNVGSSINKRPK